MRLRAVTYNIQNGGVGRAETLLEIFSLFDADVLLLQEASEPEFVERAAQALGMTWHIAHANDGLHLALLSRCQVKAFETFSPPVLRHAALRAELETRDGGTFALYGVHLSAPAFTLRTELYRVRELGLILDWIRSRADGHILLGGDFNSLAPGDEPAFDKLPRRLRLLISLQGGMIARQVIGKMRGAGFTDAFRALNLHGQGFTFPGYAPNARLDYWFVNQALARKLRACETVNVPSHVATASDHLPVLLEMDV